MKSRNLWAGLAVLAAAAVGFSYMREGWTILPSASLAAIAGTDSGLISWWKLDGNTADSAGQRSGTLQGNASFVTGKFGQALSLNGTDQAAAFEFDPFASGDASVCAWVNPSQITTSSGSIVSTVYFNFSLQKLGTVNYIMVTSDSNHTAYAPYAPSENSWHHVCAVRLAGGNASIYVDGAFLTSGNAGVPMTYYNLRIGSRATGDSWFSGLIDDVRIFNRAISASEVQEVYQDNPTVGGGSFTPYTISATAGKGGTITPSGSVTVPAGGSQTFTITPQQGFDVSSVVLDGTVLSIPTSGGSYTVTNVGANSVITATFNPVPTYTSIPQERIMDWSVAGVTGGIPARTQICQTVYPSPATPKTTSGSIVAGTKTLTVADASDFKLGQGLSVAGAAFQPWTTTPGATFYSLIKSIQGNTITLNDAPDVSVTGAQVAHNDAGGLISAINSCPAAQVVYATAGTYLLDRSVQANHSNFVLRGEGMGKTIFKTTSAVEGIMLGSADWPPPQLTIPILSGAVKGSTSITVDSTSATGVHSAFRVGGFIKIGAGTNPPYVKNIGTSEYDTQLAMTFRVTALSGNTVTFTPALPFDFSPYSPKAAIYVVDPSLNVGVEDLTVDLAGIGSNGINLSQMWDSWVKGVEIKGSTHFSLTLYAVNKSEVRGSYIHDSTRAGPSTEGLDFKRDSDWNLIEDNIVYNSGGIFLGDWEGGNSGNVIAYNFAYATRSGDDNVANLDIGLNHGMNNILNLIEGNIAGQIMTDQYFGSASHGMMLRNWFTATHPTARNNLYAIRLKHFSPYFSALGNILGTSNFPTSGSLSNGRAYGGFYEAPILYGYDGGWSTGVQAIYDLGYPNMGSTGFTGIIGPDDPIDYSSQGSTLDTAQALDLNVVATFIRHGNYDYFNRAVVWDPHISNHSIPQSYYRTSKPAFFGSLAWPPFDPNTPPGAFNSTTAGLLPAAYRYYHGEVPAGETSSPAPQPINGQCSSILNSCTVGTFSDTADSATNYLWKCTGSNGGSEASCSSAKSTGSTPSTPPAGGGGGTGTSAGGGGGGSSSGSGSVSSDTKAPVISGLAISVTPNTASISWNTDEISTSQIEYGLTAAYGSQTALNPNFSVSHSQTITKLSPKTLYHYRVKSKDAAGNVAFSPDNTFVPGATQKDLPVPISKPCDSAAGTYAFSQNFSTGSSHKEVKILQRILNQNGYPITLSGAGSLGNETEYFGPATERAVKSLQTAYKITPTGVVGSVTRLVISSLPYTPDSSCASSKTTSSGTGVSASISASTAAFQFTQALDIGSTGSQVTQLQTLLSALPNVYPEKLVTGYFGIKTKAAVGRFQEMYGVAKPGDAAYGFVGPATRGKLNALKN